MERPLSCESDVVLSSNPDQVAGPRPTKRMHSKPGADNRISIRRQDSKQKGYHLSEILSVQGPSRWRDKNRTRTGGHSTNIQTNADRPDQCARSRSYVVNCRGAWRHAP